MYIMFPIGWMYYFGTNLENRFSVPDFWPAPDTTHKIPYEKEEQKDMLKKLKAMRMERRRRRFEQEMLNAGVAEDTTYMAEKAQDSAVGSEKLADAAAQGQDDSKTAVQLGPIDQWARGR